MSAFTKLFRSASSSSSSSTSKTTTTAGSTGASETAEEEGKTVETREKTPAILVLGGSFNPVHRSHLALLSHIKRHLDDQGSYEVIQGYLVITTDRYVKRKLGKWAMKFEHRRKLCELSISESGMDSWLKASHIECVSAMRYGQLALVEFHEGSVTHIINCCGADKLMVESEGIGLWRYMSGRSKSGASGTHNTSSMVALGRDGYTDRIRKMYEKDRKKGLVSEEDVLFIAEEVASASSTRIRESMAVLMGLVDSDRSEEKRGDSSQFREECSSMVFPSCVDYIIEHCSDHDLFIDQPMSAESTEDATHTTEPAQSTSFSSTTKKWWKRSSKKT